MQELLLVTEDFSLFDELGRESSIDTRLSRIHSLEEAANICSSREIETMLVDIDSLQRQELDYFSYITNRFPELTIIVLTSLDMIDEATRALQSGALFYLLKPVSCKVIQQAIERVTITRAKRRESLEAEQQMLYDLISGSKAMEKTMRLILKVAPSSATVFMGGENGTGKEFFSQLIHRKSTQAGKFIPVNCGAIPESLFESELFGHKKGSFTGADSDKSGLAKEADGGTLFLDEVGELSPNNQVKLLRFLQERSFKPVGATEEIKIDCRIISATNRNLRQMVAEGSFREDLFYRVHVFPITLPPLRDRKETIPNLVRLFILRNTERLNKVFRGFSPGAELMLSQHDYPGNIRELENIIEHGCIMTESGIIAELDLPEYLSSPAVATASAMIEDKRDTPLQISFEDAIPVPESGKPFALPLKPLAELELDYIHFALDELGGNHSEVAKQLGVSRSTLWRKLKLSK